MNQEEPNNHDSGPEAPVPIHMVLVHRNRGTIGRETVQRFLEQAWTAHLDISMIVVDNGSDPDQLALLCDGLPDEVTVVETGRNLGFGPGANIGLSYWLASDSSICLLAPHDARPASGTVASLVQQLTSHPGAGLACADVGDGQLPRVQPWLGPIGESVEPDNDPDSLPRWELADYPHGTLMALTRDCVEQVGVFDERYFAYCEEADLGLRARAAGWEVGLVRGALVENPESNADAAVIDYLMVRNTLLLIRVHFGLANMVFRIGVVIAEHMVGYWRPTVRSPYHSGWARLRAVVDAVTGRFGPPSG
ncbi:MAG: glycosyltransferase [Actinomycetota bacterium]|nr:glycosyltransferase [Actinomycetota bacterium]